MASERRPILDPITVLIPTLGRPMLEGCLESIAEGTAWPREIVVVDQGRTEAAAAWCARLTERGLRATHVPSHERGVAAGRNRGFERASTPYVAITDDDCRVATDWLEHLAARLERHDGAVVTGRVDPGGEGVVVSVNTSTEPRVYRRPSIRGGVLFPNNMGCPVDVFDRVGPFDERAFLRYAEDNDWSHRALRAGVPIVYAPEVAVSHLDWRTDAQLAETFRAYARSQGGFFGKHLRAGDGFILAHAAVSVTRAVLRWCRGAVGRDPVLASNGRAVLTELLPGIVAGWRGAAEPPAESAGRGRPAGGGDR